ncbi:MAG TPA: hypothetical protein VF748_00500, partial [Candidatus Acidoferrum sp.]
MRAALCGAEKKIKKARQQTERPPEEGGLQAPFMGLANAPLQFIDTTPAWPFEYPHSTVSYRSASRQNRVLSREFIGAGAISNSHCILCVESQVFCLVEVRVRSRPGAVPLRPQFIGPPAHARPRYISMPPLQLSRGSNLLHFVSTNFPLSLPL